MSRKVRWESLEEQQALAKKVETRRRMLGLTIAEAARRSDMPDCSLSEYEAGSRAIPALRLHRLSQALEVPMESFFSDDE